MHEKNYWNAQNYVENSTVQTGWAIDFISHRMQLENVKQLLDLGCGDGKITVYLAKKLPHTQIIGLDPSEEMIAQASTLLSQEHLPNLSFIQGNGENTPFATPLDAVVSFSCLHWVPNQKLLMSTLASKMKKGGRLYFLCAPKIDYNLNVILNAATNLPQWKPYFSHYTDHMYLLTPDEWSHLLKQAGFITKRVELIASPTLFPSKEKLSNWVAAWAPPLRQLPPALHSAFMGDVMELYFQKHPNKDPSAPLYDDIMLEVEANT